MNRVVKSYSSPFFIVGKIVYVSLSHCTSRVNNIISVTFIIAIFVAFVKNVFYYHGRCEQWRWQNTESPRLTRHVCKHVNIDLCWKLHCVPLRPLSAFLLFRVSCFCDLLCSEFHGGMKPSFSSDGGFNFTIFNQTPAEEIPSRGKKAGEISPTVQW